MAAIEDDGGSKVATNGVLTGKVHITQVVGQKRSGQPCHSWEPSSSGKLTQKLPTT